MGKVVKGILSVGLVIGLAVLAAPTGGLSLIAMAGIKGVAAVALSAGILAVGGRLISSVLMGKPKQVSSSLADRLNLSVVPTAPRKIVFGKTAAGADVRYQEKGKVSGQSGEFWFQIVALASHKVHSIDEVHLEDELSFSGGSTTGKFTTDNGLSITAITEGSAGNAAAFGSSGLWSSSSRFTGCAYLKLRMKLSDKAYPEGIPSRITTVVRGCPVYDPRLDSTNGGSGSHRPNDQSTWSFLDGSDEIGRNPALCLLTYLLGYKINGVNAWGMGIPSSRINFASFITYANICEETVSTASGSTVQRYQCDGYSAPPIRMNP